MIALCSFLKTEIDMETTGDHKLPLLHVKKY